MSARVAFVTNAPLFEGAEGLYSPLSSVRHEILWPARALSARGVATHVVSLATWPAAQVREVVARADYVVFGSLEAPEQANAYRKVLDEGSIVARSVFCFADEHFDQSFYLEMAASCAWVTSSPQLKPALEARARCPVLCYRAVAELPPGDARVPRYGMRQRVGLWLAQRANVGVDPWRLRLMWFGSDADALLGLLPELERLARELPLALECVTEPSTALERSLASSNGAALRITLTRWSFEHMRVALEQCDAVVLPEPSNGQVDALNAGRFVVAPPVTEGLRWLLRHPAEALARIAAGQKDVAQHHSMDALADFWTSLPGKK